MATLGVWPFASSDAPAWGLPPGAGQPGETRAEPGALDSGQAPQAVISPLPPDVELKVSPETFNAPPYIMGTVYPERLAAPGNPMVEAATARVQAEGGQLTEAEMLAVLRAAGAPEEWIPDMLTIAWCESHYSPGAVGDSGNSLGLFQLWSGWARPGEDLFDPLTNARVAVRVREIRGRFGGGGGWSCADLNGIS